jgi:formate hydrogenlyase subunit 3/multisubunit Na+/H+ antiporter MnhD subunit
LAWAGGLRQNFPVNDEMAILIAESAVLTALLSAILPLFFLNRPHLQSLVAFFLLGGSGLAAALGGGMALLLQTTGQVVLPIGLPWLHVSLCLDPLAGFFLFIVGFITFTVACYGSGYIREYIGGQLSIGTLTFFTGLFACGMFLVLLAADAFSFMLAWELMSLASYFLVVFQHHQPENRHAAFIYLLMAVVGGAFLFLAYGVLAGFSDGFSFAAMKAADLSPTWATIAFTFAFLGFGLKAGIVPLHVWLPLAHPVAPSHISAMMSGVMLKVAVYGFIRFVYDLLGNIIWQWGVVVLLVGSASAVLGVLYALMQHDLKRLLAYHSVENIGIIYIGLGLSMIFHATHHLEIAALALIAALYHCLNHAIFKSLLFLGAGAILQQSRQHDMEKMGGLIKKMPVTAFCFLVGCISISALPPFNGFVSEWLTFQAALQGPILKSGILGAMIPVAAAMLALTGALAAACFVKVYGIIFLGRARSPEIEEAQDPSFGMRVSQMILAVCCLGFGIFPTWVVRAINGIPESLMGTGLSSATDNGWLWLTPVSAQTASYGAPAVFFGILVSWLIVFVFLHPLRRDNRIRIVPAWDCGFGPLNSRMQYTASAFAMPLRRIFSFIWLIVEKVEPAGPGKGPRYILKIDDRVWLMFYVPIGKIMLKLAERTSRIQGGNLRVYLCYSFFTLLFLLWVIV